MVQKKKLIHLNLPYHSCEDPNLYSKSRVLRQFLKTTQQIWEQRMISLFVIKSNQHQDCHFLSILSLEQRDQIRQ